MGFIKQATCCCFASNAVVEFVDVEKSISVKPSATPMAGEAGVPSVELSTPVIGKCGFPGCTSIQLTQCPTCASLGKDRVHSSFCSKEHFTKMWKNHSWMMHPEQTLEPAFFGEEAVKSTVDPTPESSPEGHDRKPTLTLKMSAISAADSPPKKAPSTLTAGARSASKHHLSVPAAETPTIESVISGRMLARPASVIDDGSPFHRAKAAAMFASMKSTKSVDEFMTSGELFNLSSSKVWEMGLPSVRDEELKEDSPVEAVDAKEEAKKTALLEIEALEDNAEIEDWVLEELEKPEKLFFWKGGKLIEVEVEISKILRTMSYKKFRKGFRSAIRGAVELKQIPASAIQKVEKGLTLPGMKKLLPKSTESSEVVITLYLNNGHRKVFVSEDPVQAERVAMKLKAFATLCSSPEPGASSPNSPSNSTTLNIVGSEKGLTRVKKLMSLAASCQECGEKFGVRKFPHVCKNCNKIVCGNCSKQRALITAYKADGLSRICSSCSKGFFHFDS